MRRETKQVHIGSVTVGGDAPVRVQSMLNTSTNDTEASIAQAVKIIEAGGEIVRLTTQGEREAKNMANIRAGLNKLGYASVPLVADVHFNPKAAFEAARHIEKVRINPGNFAQTNEEADEKFTAFINLCKEKSVAIRLGVNHGSLSKRIMERYGDTPEGMVESCMEYLRICKREGFSNVVVSVKASNVRVMVQTVRLMATTMDAEGLNFPLHLGVTEAGNDFEGRVKSAVGIGTLLAEGIGDTIRVSLSEAPEREIPVAREILKVIAEPDPDGVKKITLAPGDPGDSRIIFADVNAKNDKQRVVFLRHYTGISKEELTIRAACELGPLFVDRQGDGLLITADAVEQEFLDDLMLTILQAARARMSKTEYISCPSCGRTLFDIEGTIAKIKAATAGQSHLKIGIMGCIVNGPGEMADADYGYVGASPGHISLYKGQQVVRKNIPQDDAVEALVQLIKDNGDWR